MKTTLLLLVLASGVLSSYAQTKKWVTNFGIELATDGMFGLAGMSSVQKADNPLVANNFEKKYAAGAGFYAEFLQLHKRENTGYGSIAPGFGIKTKIDWQFFRADNSSNGGGESTGLNFLNVPVLFEYYTSYRQGVTRASYTPGTTTYQGRQNSDGSVTVTENSTSGTYSRGGDKTSGGSYVYFGPQISYLFKSFNYSGDPINDQNLVNNYIGVVGGFAFCLHQLNFDFSYQKGLTSIYTGKNITIDGFMFRFGINFGRRLYNK